MCTAERAQESELPEYSQRFLERHSGSFIRKHVPEVTVRGHDESFMLAESRAEREFNEGGAASLEGLRSRHYPKGLSS